MRYLLDSDVLIDFLGEDLETPGRVGKLIAEGASISVISYMEALQGLIKANVTGNAAVEFAAFLKDLTIFEVTISIAQRCAEIRHVLRADERVVRKRGLDLLIGATAIEYGLTLITRNRDDFHDVPGLKMINI
jgi:predicted nucleic acid-binding protein